MPRALPFAGIVIGCIGALILCAGIWLHFGNLVAAGLAVAAITFVTGAFHEDGLADTSDGFGGGTTAERRLVIMKDSLIGSFGASALALAFIIRVAALGEVTGRLSLATAAGTIIVAAFLSRISALYILVALPSAREDGLSRTVGKTSWSNYLSGLILAWILSLAICVACGLPAFAWFAMPVAPLIVTFLMTQLSKRMIGGQTGDVAGASQQLGEIAVYLAMLGAT